MRAKIIESGGGKMKSIWVYPEKCTGCSQCIMVCSYTKTGKYSPRDALLQLLSWEEHCLTIPVVCAQCENAPCQAACPVDAIYRSPENGAVVVDEALCTACGLCMEACPTGSIFIDRHSNAAIKCDLCGGQPACVEVCYPGALHLDEIEWAKRLEQREWWVEARKVHGRQQLPGFPITVKE